MGQKQTKNTRFERRAWVWIAAAVSMLGIMWIAGAGTDLRPFKGGPADATLSAHTADPGLLLLLVPDATPADQPWLLAWRRAAVELGVRLQPISDRDFLRLGNATLGYAALVLPDSLHTEASDDLAAAVRRYVRAGGHALLTYDFGVLLRNARGAAVYPIPDSRFSGMAGVAYARYDALRERMIARGPVVAKRSILRLLQVPPGQSMQFTGRSSAVRPRVLKVSRLPANTAANSTAVKSSGLDARPPLPATEVDPLHAYAGPSAGMLSYPGFVTAGALINEPIAASPTFGVAAARNHYGQGDVFFVNLPLAYLAVRGDGLPLQGFLSYFVHQVLQAAYLSPMPDGVPGLTLDWHLDPSTAQAPSLALERMGIFDGGPFSIHIAGGSDGRASLGPLGNEEARQLLHRLKAKGHEVGRHGASFRERAPITSQVSLEQLGSHDMSKTGVPDGYRELADFCRDNDTACVISLRPSAALAWLDVVQDLLAYVQAQGPQRLRWYTAAQVADALAQRSSVEWRQKKEPNGFILFEAWHPASLQGLVWRLPKSSFRRPLLGFSWRAKVEDGGAYWIVRARDTRSVSFFAMPAEKPKR